MMNVTQRKVFFDAVRNSLFKVGFGQAQVETLDAVLDYWYEKHATKPRAFLAYILATAYWETFPDFYPNRERGGNAYLRDMYDLEGKRPHKARELGNTQPGDGVRYAGAGLVHATGRKNYRKVDKRYGLNTEANPAQMLSLPVAVIVLVEGMIDGIFTGVRLDEVIQTDNETLSQFLDNRAIINGKDKALDIARIAYKFQTAINEALDAPSWSPPQEGMTTVPEWEDNPPEFTAMVSTVSNPFVPQPVVDPEYLAWKEAQAKEAESKPLIQSTVFRAVVAGAVGWLGLRYGIAVPPELQAAAEGALLSLTGAAVLWGRAKATKTISGFIRRA